MTPAEFKLMFPEFAATDDDVVQAAIDAADPFFDACRWDGFYTVGLGNYVAHELTLSAQTAASSAAATRTDVIETEVRDIRTKRDGSMLAKQAANPYLRTLYGQKYWQLVQRVGSGAVAV